MSAPTVPPLSCAAAKALLDAGRAILVDIREPDEIARERIDGALTLASTGADPARGNSGMAVVYYCASGMRTAQAAARLPVDGYSAAYRLEGGLQAWKAAGYSVLVHRHAPLPIMRQVQITAGALVLCGVLLGVLGSPWFLALSGFVGAGLMFAGISGWCGMARLLARMPWNRLPDDGGAPGGAPLATG